MEQQESSSCSLGEWTREEDKAFEEVLADLPKSCSEPPPNSWWESAAHRLHGRWSSLELMAHYEKLVEDIELIEADRIPPPDYDQVQQRRSYELKPQRKKGQPWSEEEHKLFLRGLNECSGGDWKGISRYWVKTRSASQVASHAQKYFNRQKPPTGNGQRRRLSIHDITDPTKPVDPQQVPKRLSLVDRINHSSCPPELSQQHELRNIEIPPKDTTSSQAMMINSLGAANQLNVSQTMSNGPMNYETLMNSVLPPPGPMSINHGGGFIADMSGGLQPKSATPERNEPFLFTQHYCPEATPLGSEITCGNGGGEPRILQNNELYIVRLVSNTMSSMQVDSSGSFVHELSNNNEIIPNDLPLRQRIIVPPNELPRSQSGQRMQLGSICSSVQGGTDTNVFDLLVDQSHHHPLANPVLPINAAFPDVAMHNKELLG